MRVVVVGGANVDIKLRAAGAIRLGTSNPGSTHTSLGGVARNVAENLALLGARVQLMTVVGDDEFGRRIIERAAALAIETDLICVGVQPTGTYAALLDSRGRMVAAVSSMAAIDALTSTSIEAARGAIAAADAVVCDCNLSAAAILRLGQLAAEANVNLFVDAVSAPKVLRIRRLLDSLSPPAGLFLNRDELEALTALPTRGRRQLASAAARLHARGVRNVAASLGARGVFVSMDGQPPEQTVLPAMAETVVDVTGAGDAAVAATVWAFGAGNSFVEAARTGQAAAALTVASGDTVDPCLDGEAIARVLAARSVR